MPIFDMECTNCGHAYEFIKIKTTDIAVCPECGSDLANQLLSTFQIRMDPDTVKRSLPDPSPPLEELRGKNKPGTTGGYADKPYADPQLKNYTRRKDKRGNWHWNEKRRSYFHKGKHSKRSSAEITDAEKH